MLFETVTGAKNARYNGKDPKEIFFKNLFALIFSIKHFCTFHDGLPPFPRIYSCRQSQYTKNNVIKTHHLSLFRFLTNLLCAERYQFSNPLQILRLIGLTVLEH